MMNNWVVYMTKLEYYLLNHLNFLKNSIHFDDESSNYFDSYLDNIN